MRRIMAGMHIPDLDQVGNEYREMVAGGKWPAPMSRLNAKTLISAIKKAGFQAFWFYSKGGYGNAFYPTGAGHMLSTLHGRDIFGELCETCLAEGIAPLAIYESSDRRICAERPEWTHTADPDGKQPVDACVFSPYGNYVLAQMREILEHYPVKAYYLDALGCAMKGEWLCPACRREFEERFGMDFPGLSRLTHEQHTALIRFRIEKLRDFTEKARALAKSIRPDVAFTYNYIGSPSACDFVTCDLFAHESGSLALNTGLRRNAALSLHPPGEVLLDSVTQSMRVKGRDGYAAEVWAARSLNVAVCGSLVMDASGAAPADEMALAAELCREQTAFEPWLEGMRPVFQVGILNSHNSRRYRPPLAFSKNAVVNQSALNVAPPHADEFAGWASAAGAAHVFWNYVDELQLDAGKFPELDVLVLPGVSCLSDAQSEAVMEFVRAGGVLLASGDVSLFDETGRRRPNFRLAQLLGVDLADDWRPDYAFYLDGAGAPLQWNMGQWPVAPRTGARVAAQAARTPSFGLTMMSPLPPFLPAMVEHSYGKGRCVYFAGMPGLQFARGGMAADKAFLTRALLQAVGDKMPLAVEGAGLVDAYAHIQPDQRRLIVNLVNMPAGASRTLKRDCFEDIDKFAPVCGMAVRFRKSAGALPARIYLAPGRQIPEVMEDEDGIVATVPRFTVHAALVAEYDKGIECLVSRRC